MPCFGGCACSEANKKNEKTSKRNFRLVID
jgi:hypothetical protein